MSKSTIKFTIAGTVLLSGIAYLAYAGMKDGWVQYHLPVDTFVNDAQFHGQRVRLAGKVADENVVTGAGRLGAQFPIVGETQSLQVNYKGIVPDLFKAGCEVVIEGKLDAAGVFQADLLMTKCASKYEEANGKQTHPAAGEGKASPH